MNFPATETQPVNFATDGTARAKFTGAPRRRPGEKWSQDSRYGGSTQAAGQHIGGDVRVKETCRAVKTESVSVPAGTFNALRVECARQITAQGGAVGIGTGNTSVSTKRTDCYAAGVGLVKSQSEDSETALARYRLP